MRLVSRLVATMDRRWLAALIAAVVITQGFLARCYFGFFTGDDVEILSEAFRVALGFDYRPWDIRSLVIPDLVVAPAVFLASWFGVRKTAHLIEAATLPFIAVSAVTIWLVHRLARRCSDDRVAAAVATILFALHWLPLGFGSTVYPRTIATACVIGAVLLSWPARSHWRAFAAGALMAVAFADRFSEIVFLLPLLLLARRRAAALLAGAIVVIVMTLGVYDWWTWGEAFGSVRKFAHLTLVEPDFASRVKYQSPWWYLETFPRWCALTLLPFFYAARKSPAARSLVWFIAIPLVALSAIQHKEMRYLQALIPFVMIVAGLGFAALWRASIRWRPIYAALLVVSVAWNLYGLKFLGQKTMPAVEAARMLGSDPAVRKVAMSQPWAYGDRLYLTDRMAIADVGTPPRGLAAAIADADAVALYERDVTPEVRQTLRQSGFHATHEFRRPRARDVIVFRRRGFTREPPLTLSLSPRR
jgi:hypothetical protein